MWWVQLLLWRFPSSSNSQISTLLHLLRCGPNASAPLPGLHWSLVEMRLEKQLAQGSGLKSDLTSAITKMVKFRYYCTFLASNYAWALVGASHLHRFSFKADTDGKICSGSPLIGQWYGMRRMGNGWQDFRQSLASRYCLARCRYRIMFTCYGKSKLCLTDWPKGIYHRTSKNFTRLYNWERAYY